ncbi:MAG: DUF5320 domain-containing protein [Candidatus Coatesbacteria bacterium]|nr:DUF5320 domain-containing protein [Candidatus Coatesbacteria bacterium]
MPRGDRTGPTGLGPMTGRAAGYCSGFSTPGFMNPVSNRGALGRGRGFSFGGRGYRHMYNAFGTPGWYRMSMGYPAFAGQVNPYPNPYGTELNQKQEAEILKNQAEILKKELEDIQNRIETLEKMSTQE